MSLLGSAENEENDSEFCNPPPVPARYCYRIKSMLSILVSSFNSNFYIHKDDQTVLLPPAVPDIPAIFPLPEHLFVPRVDSPRSGIYP